MSVSTERLKNSLLAINKTLKSNEINGILMKKKIVPQDIDEIIVKLCEELIKDPNIAVTIRDNIQYLLLPIVCSFLSCSESTFTDYQVKCIALSLFAEKNLQILRYSRQFFNARKESPFEEKAEEQHQTKKLKLTKTSISDIQIVQMCLRFLTLDPCFYRRVWDWSEFVQLFSNKGCDLQKLYYNKIVSIVFGLSNRQTELLNEDIPIETIVENDIIVNSVNTSISSAGNGDMIDWKFENDEITHIEGVYLPIYNKSVVEYYHEKLDIVKVDSTSINLRSLALGVSSGRAVCLCGVVGSGKTTLVEYLAKKVGRLPPKSDEFNEFVKSKEKFYARQINGNKRKRETDPNSTNCLDLENPSISGFLRIQLGDQTDSKVLLGQYRCTDVPGEFVWQPGVLTQAVMYGHWILLEDIDTATQDVCAILTNLLENNFLRVPGFRENLKVSHGFQLFMTLRTQKQTSHSSNSAYSLLEKHLYTINMLPLSRAELAAIICENYPKLSTVSTRIVDVFLIFSRGNHTNEIECEDIEFLRDHNTKITNVITEESEALPYSSKFKLNNVSNSGRTVSTRDLLKLCKRSIMTFKATSSECAYLVFQNCVDLFCSHLPSGELKTDLIISIGARLGIIETRCIHLSSEYKPTVKLTSEEIIIGREKIARNSKENVAEKRLKVSDEDVTKISQNKSPPPTFSFTRVSSCILERISVAVHQNEPILLVGETGTGKTSSVQYLAYQTSHNLVVVNMNNQSDVSDLIGGYKPVDMQFMILPLRNEFENLFGRTFDILKNEKFLSHIASCVNRSDYSILIKLMVKVIGNAYKVLDGNVSKNDDLKKWQNLERKLKKLDQQLKHSLNISFAFIPGSLVNCIRNGDWVLLDEINLASTETLECLSTILEPDGSIILLERGDFVPIKRHPNFRIFACMNPSTDVGKKDLPVGIRNRFTEFFVDELTVEKDLLILVGDYLSNTGIEKSRIHKAVQLYMDLRNLSQMELNDGLGNKPVFSLRTLCRALRTCAKNLCGSTERNLYESFCLSFLTQLDAQSHQMVLQKIQKYLVSDVKKILSQQIPKPLHNVINFEGFWIDLGDKEPAECKEYILTESVQKNLKDLARIISIGKLPILIQGPTSAGKTSLIEYIAKKSGNHCLRINNHEHTDLQEYVGTYVADSTGKLSFQEGVLVKAMRNGYWIILDELNLAPSDILEALNRVLDDNRELFIPETQVLVKAHPNFMLFATQNPPGIYGGRKTLSRAFKNRFIELHFSEIPKNELEIILEKRCMIPMKYAQKMVKTMSNLQINRRTTTRNNFTLRDLFRWGNRYTFADNSLLQDRNYDWNQHLVDEGYLVLSAKVRNQTETDIIIETLKKNFSKDISTENLFSLSEKTSKVTKNILESLMNYKGAQNVVWTYEMRRMAVLVSKSMQFNEPVLLVGPTGCGKTTVCQLLAELHGKNLRILNCHMHTESADFIGGLRPSRESKETTNGDHPSKLFEWADGPLIYSMHEGSYFLADEISLAEDSVLERLNCVLEPERKILLAEKGGMNEETMKSSEHSEFVVTATAGFQFLATMNPGGDFGKKELSPALRNRFTELWCSAMYCNEDLMKIAVNLMEVTYKTKNHKIEKIAEVIVKTVNVLKKLVDKLNFSIRDILAYVNYITQNFDLTNSQQSNIDLYSTLTYGFKTIFLDSLEMLPYENINEIANIRDKCFDELHKNIKMLLQSNENAVKITSIEESNVEINLDSFKFGIKPFYLDVNHSLAEKPTTFTFSAPTTKQNLFRVLSAMSVKKAILLEGPPGVGKSSLIENIASAIGYNLVRINLCEHTDIADLFGTDLPVESSIFDNDNSNVQLGAFMWRDGPLLAALKSPNTWILLDELNLAPQSVLEGLNAILDHRGEVYITELNKTFKLGQETRIFATQNPLRQGGNRKGLPQSFLNRFTKVYLRKLEKADLFHVVSHNFKILDEVQMLKNYNLIDKMVTFSEIIETGIANLEFGFKGGPFEANLRDMLRWCELLTNKLTGYDVDNIKNLADFQQVLFEKMKLVYCQRMRTDHDVECIVKIFGDIFQINVDELNRKSESIGLYWNDSSIFFNDIKCNKKNSNCLTDTHSIILSSQLSQLKSLIECVLLEKPVILCGATDCGKTKIIETFCEIYNENLNFDTIDDSVTGSFQQFDFNRMLEELWKSVEEILVEKIVKDVVGEDKSNSNGKSMFRKFYKLWKEYEEYSLVNHNDYKSNEVEHFCKRLDLVETIIELLISHSEQDFTPKISQKFQEMLENLNLWQNFLTKSSSTLNTGGHFVWIDSMIVKSIKFGHFICLEHVNLVSSAILDRLNPILEPNGSLMIAEKGVDEASQQPETIKKHENFRIFLTTDPKFGEVSRAMRNRCIEMSLSHQLYTDDDLKKLIYLQGIEEMYLIEAIIDIHKSLSSLSDYSTFGVSHVVKMAFLVSQNKSMGLEYTKCLTISAMEVYVRSSNVDLLGFGLPYYRSKLKQQIVGVVDNVKVCENIVNYRNLIICASEMSEMSMIKYQCEALLGLMRCSYNPGQVLRNLHTKLGGLEINNVDNFGKYLLTFLYMLSSFSDVEKRHIYLHKMMTTNSLNPANKNSSNLIDLNKKLFSITKEFSKSKIPQDLPWNSKMFSRITAYKNSKLSATDEFRITLLLIMKTTLDEISVDKSVTLNSINSITYSKAVQQKAIADTVNNKVLTELFKLLNSFKSFVETSLRSKNLEIDEQVLGKLLASFLWFNRILSTSMKKLFIKNNVKTELLDELYLHLKWLGKHCVEYIKVPDLSHQFITTFNVLQNYILGHHHTLQIYKKIFVKKFTSFMPFYSEKQIEKFKEMELMCESMVLVSKMNEPLEFREYQSRLMMIMDERYQKIKRQQFVSSDADIEDIFGIFTEDLKESDCYEAWIDNFKAIESIVFEDRHGKSIKQEINDLKLEMSQDEINDVMLRIEMLPVCEYFFIKALIVNSSRSNSISDQNHAQIRDQSSSLQPKAILLNPSILNEDFMSTSVPSIDNKTLSVAKILADNRFKILNSCDVSSKDFHKKLSSFKLKINSIVQESVHKSLLINNQLCRSYKNEEIYCSVNNRNSYISSGLLTSNIMSFLMTKNGENRKTGLGKVGEWTASLNDLQRLLFMNAEINGSGYDILGHKINENRKFACDLLSKIEIVKSQCQSIENENYSDFNREFWNVVGCLRSVTDRNGQSWLENYTIQSLSSVLLLNLLAYFPLIDPVKKNLLKTNYCEDDIDHLQHILMAYKIMSIMMEYENLGIENCEAINKEIAELKEKHIKYSKQTALRPQTCQYSPMVKDINHYLTSFCHPKQFGALVSSIEKELMFEIDSKSIKSNQMTEANKTRLSDMISKLELWIVNADKFLEHTMKKYNVYYQDFTAPIHYAVTLLKDAMLGLKTLLIMKHDSIQVTTNGVYWNCSGNNKLSGIMKELIEFPSKSSHVSFMADGSLKCHFFNIIESIENGENLYFEMVKSNIQEVSNTSSILAGEMNQKLFQKFDGILNVCNQLWQKQEELKAKRQAEEDSLYVTKTKCQEDDEELVKLREIEEMFPDNAANDFNDFIQKDTLEQTVNLEKSSKKLKEIITSDDYELIGNFFIGIMNSQRKFDEKDFVTTFRYKMKIFGMLFENFKSCLDSSIDIDAYNGLSLVVGLTLDEFDDHQISGTSSKSFNFYKDSNVQEALSCIDVMTKLEKRVRIELEQWPDHAVLNDLIIIINRIKSFPCDSSLVRFNVGMQILRKKVYDWNTVAHRLNNFKDIEHEIGEIIQKWMRMELQCWRESLKQSFRNVETKSFRYWFFLYNLIHEFLKDSSNAEMSYVDFDNVEKRFGRQEIVDDSKIQSGSISIEAVAKVLKQFVESSSYAEFSLRLKLLKSFEKYLVNLYPARKDSRAVQLTALLHNLHEYFIQFTHRVQEHVDFVRGPIEDKLKKFVKINSFNKDLSYFGTESNIKQVHRNLHKFLKEFEIEISRKITDLFLYKETGTELDIGQYTQVSIPQQPFIVTDDLLEIDSNLNRFILKSRLLIENLLTNVQYPKIIDDLDLMIRSELERCNHLRSLKVDETLPRSKQKSQAKSILNQKRKALSDFFKTMMTIGVNYKSGLLLDTLNPQLIDLYIEPFCVKELKFSGVELRKSMEVIGQKMEIYFNKSIFKMKLLKNLLLQPRSDMDGNFIDRIKGISIEFFNIVQEDRKYLGRNLIVMKNLEKKLQEIQVIVDPENKFTDEKLSFEMASRKLEIIKNCYVYSIEILEQQQILLKCAPSSDDKKEMKVLLSTNNVLHKKSQIYIQIMSKMHSVLSDLSAKAAGLNSRDCKFSNDADEFYSHLKGIKNKLLDLKEYFVVDNEYSVYGKAACDLIELLENDLVAIKGIEFSEQLSSSKNVSEDLENLSHLILLAIQNMYKEYRDTANESEESHVKDKLHNKLVHDMDVLNLTKITSKLSNIIDNLFVMTEEQHVEHLRKLHPLIKQYKLLAEYFIVQHLNANKTSTKMLSIMLSVFLELTKNGFCIPENLLTDEEQQEKDTKTGEGFGFEDGQGEKDVSDKLESEDQLDEAKKQEEYNKGDEQQNECKEEKGIDMSDNFDGKMHDMPENESDSENENNDSENEEMDKEMGDTKEGADKLDDQIWGSDEEKDAEEEEQEKNDETGKGSDEKGDKHNDLAAENENSDQKSPEQQDGLDAAAEKDKKKQQSKPDIDQLEDQDEGDQANPYHNQLEDPPEPEDFDLNDEMNLDNNEKSDDKEPPNEENPFDIDKMKEQMDESEDLENNDESEKRDEKSSEKGDDSSDDEGNPENLELPNEQQNEDLCDENDEESIQQPGLDEKDENGGDNDETEKNDHPNDFNEAHDKMSKEENIQSMPNQKDQKSSADQVPIENIEQENAIDDQDTGEDRDGIGQAENKESESGHQGVSETNESKSNKNRKNDEMRQQKRKKGNTDEDRTLGNVDDLKKKFLKTIDKINETQEREETSDQEDESEESEYQHVKDAKKSDKTTMDNATEEQSKSIKHDEKSQENSENFETQDELMDENVTDEPEIDEIKEEMKSKQLDEKSKKPSKYNEQTKDRLTDQQNQEVIVDGENVVTMNVPRRNETTAHCQMDIVNDTTICDESNAAEELEVRKKVEAEILSQKLVHPNAENMEDWQKISNQMVTNARELCEQLRLILEPTKCTRLKGDYRTGRRINMKKIIPYIASQFRKDKIWLRRTKAAQRDYKITIAVDDSKSMDHNNSKELTLQTISLVSQALTLLESGKLSVVSFGESCNVLLKYNDQFNGPKLINSLNFDQNKTRIADLLDFTRVMNQEDASSSNSMFEHLLIILSDGRNIFSEGEKRVKNAIKMARMQRMFLIYIIIDNPDNKDSILDIRTVLPFTSADKSMKIISYMDNFPFPYFVIVRDLNQLPIVLSEGLRQWFELVNSE